jgi:3-oxoadipate enol-lactonase
MAGNLKQFVVMALPVFVVICFAAAALAWLGVLDWLGRVLTPVMALFNLPGEAATAVVLGSIRKDGLAIGLLDELDWATANVVGVSFGGMVAQELAVRYPDRIRKLVLCCTSPGGEGGASYPLHTLAGMDPEAEARQMIPISDTRHDAAWQAAHPDAFAAMLAFRLNSPWADEPRRALGAELQLLARRDHDVWDRLPSITAPTLICGGRYDGIALPETQTRLADRIPDAQLRMFEGGHMFLIQDRAAFPAITDFLQAP